MTRHDSISERDILTIRKAVEGINTVAMSIDQQIQELEEVMSFYGLKEMSSHNIFIKPGLDKETAIELQQRLIELNESLVVIAHSINDVISE